MNSSNIVEAIFEITKKACVDACKQIPLPETIVGASPDYIEGKHMAVHQCVHNIEKMVLPALNTTPSAFQIKDTNGADIVLLSATSQCLGAYLTNSAFVCIPLYA